MQNFTIGWHWWVLLRATLYFFAGWNFYFAIPKITSSSKCMRTYYARTRTWPMLWQSQKPKKFQQEIMLSGDFTSSTLYWNEISLWKLRPVCDPYPERVKVKLQESFQLSTFIVITPSLFFKSCFRNMEVSGKKKFTLLFRILFFFFLEKIEWDQ